MVLYYIMKNKAILLIIFLQLLVVNNYIYSQLFLPFFFNQNMQYDIEKQELGQIGVNYFYENKIDSAIYYYERLSKISNEKTINFNLSVFYGYKRDTNMTLKQIFLYVDKCKNNNFKLGAFTKSPVFNFLNRNSKFNLLIEKCRKLDTCCNRYQDIIERIDYCDLKEQEILGNPKYYNGEKLNEKNFELKNNSKSISDILNNLLLYNNNNLGNSLPILQIIILHMDYSPNEQLKLGRLIINSQDSLGFNKKQAAYIVDRALKNLSLPQEYGTIIINNNKTDSLYKLDNLEQVIERRKKMNLQSLENYLINRQITK